MLRLRIEPSARFRTEYLLISYAAVYMSSDTYTPALAFCASLMVIKTQQPSTFWLKQYLYWWSILGSLFHVFLAENAWFGKLLVVFVDKDFDGLLYTRIPKTDGCDASCRAKIVHRRQVLEPQCYGQYSAWIFCRKKICVMVGGLRVVRELI